MPGCWENLLRFYMGSESRFPSQNLFFFNWTRTVGYTFYFRYRVFCREPWPGYRAVFAVFPYFRRAGTLQLKLETSTDKQHSISCPTSVQHSKSLLQRCAANVWASWSQGMLLQAIAFRIYSSYNTSSLLLIPVQNDIRCMGVGRGQGGLCPLDFEIWHFSITLLAKKIVLVVSGAKIKFHHFWSPLEKSFWLPLENRPPSWKIHHWPPFEKILPMPMIRYI